MIPLRDGDQPDRVRPAGAGLARPDALHRRHGHRVPDAHRRDRQRRAVAAAAARTERAVARLGRRRGRPADAAASDDHPPAALDDDLRRHLEHLQVERRLAPRTLAMYGEAFGALAGLRRGRQRGRCARCRRTTCGAGPHSCTGRGWPPRRSRSCCRPGAASTAGWGSPGSSASTRSTACARRVPASRCRRRCRSITPWRWPSTGATPATRCSPRATIASSSCCTAAACASASWSGWTRVASAERRRLDRSRRCQRARARQGQQAPQRAGRRARRCAALDAWLAVRAQLARPRRGGALRQPSRHPADPEPGPLAAAGAGGAGRVCRRMCIRTCCGTRSPRTCCSRAATCARCRSCSATRTSRRRRSTRSSTFGTWRRSTTRRTRGRGGRRASPADESKSLDLSSRGVEVSGARRAQRCGRAAGSASLRRSPRCGDCPALLDPRSHRGTRCVRCAHCAQTAAMSQMTKRVLRTRRPRACAARRRRGAAPAAHPHLCVDRSGAWS